jgi:CubicO group peptidase (beta-lactamase class C family)
LDTLFEDYLTEGKVPGGVALVAHKGELIYHQAFGNRDLEQNIQQDKKDLFRIASMTKPITAVAAMMLYEEGKFQLDDPVSQYIPAFANPQILESVNLKDSTYTSVPAKSEITVRQLFTQSSG